MKKSEFKPVIGLEIHAELRTKSKMFCGCANDSDEHHPNVNICQICLGHPGTLPVINQGAVREVIKSGLALNCKILKESKFDRKNYFYPDLPKGYQISQYDKPFCKDGFLKIGDRKIRITRIHLEEDTGRLLHPKGANYSLVDFNRAGIPLMELVTEPDIVSALEAKRFAQELRLILLYLRVSDANMEKGQLRVEANISISLKASKNSKLGTKVEIKNLNSFKAVERAINYEIKRQAEVIRKGKNILQETRGWDEIKQVTFSQRIKEEAQDYRYFPEPDLPPLTFTEEQITEIRSEIPELPQSRRKRLTKEYKLDREVVEFFVQNKSLGEYFEKVVSEFEPHLSRKKLSDLISLATNYIVTDLQGLMKETGVSGEDLLITPENFAEFITLIENKKILRKIAKTVLSEMFKKGADPSHIIEDRGLTQITKEDEIINIVREVISKNKKAVSDLKKGKENVFQFLIGQVMAKTKGRVDPKTASEIIKKELEV
ncbi:MAG: Asp-tRNA(Asn)/Glu-tRNA(Gln) amidotransferase subunit GatB [Patescibacteria group bacterium]|nr:Asp-tRNA(Asn)/Glu-tRNA(Gln) amidotransferase subunit GatB [Patescibacteria group bacterium]